MQNKTFFYTVYYVFRMILTINNHHFLIQGPAEIPDDLVTQVWVETLAWEICPWAPFFRVSKHCNCHGALVCRASGFCCGDDFQKQRFCRCDSVDISSALQYSSEWVSLVAILLPLGISQEQGARKETKDNGGLETEVAAVSPTMLQRVMQNFQKCLRECVNKGRHLADTIFRKWIL